MAKSINLVVLTGRLGRDAEVKFLPSGTAVVEFSIATDRSYKKGDEWQTDTEWTDISAFKAEWAQNMLVKGAMVTITGRLQTRTWEGKDGAKHSRTGVVADQIVPMSGKREGGSPAEPAKRSQPTDAVFPEDELVPF